ETCPQYSQTAIIGKNLGRHYTPFFTRKHRKPSQNHTPQPQKKSNPHPVAEVGLSPLPGFRVVVIVGLVFLTWRMAVINLCFGLTGNRWLSNAPLFVPMVFWTVVAVFHTALDANS